MQGVDLAPVSDTAQLLAVAHHVNTRREESTPMFQSCNLLGSVDRYNRPGGRGQAWPNETSTAFHRAQPCQNWR